MIVPIVWEDYLQLPQSSVAVFEAGPVHNEVSQRPLCFLDFDDGLFESVAHDKADQPHGLSLADAMDTRHGLLFEHGVPLRLDEKGVIGSSEIESGTALSVMNPRRMERLTLDHHK